MQRHCSLINPGSLLASTNKVIIPLKLNVFLRRLKSLWLPDEENSYLDFRPEKVVRVESEGFQDEEACPGYLEDVPQLKWKPGV